MVDHEGERSRQAVLVFVDEPSQVETVFILNVLRRYRLLIALCALFSGLVGLTYGLLAPKWYRAQTLIAPVSQQLDESALGNEAGQLGGLASLVGIGGGSEGDQKKEALARLSSREFIYGFLQAENALPVLFSSKWDLGANHWKTAVKQPTVEDGYRYFTTEVFTVSEDRRTDLTKVTVDWKDPALARKWANDLVARANEDERATARTESERNLTFLNRELEHASDVELRQAIDRLMEREIRKLMLVNVREQFAFKVIDRAFLPDDKAIVKPRIAIISVASLLIGGLFGVLIAVYHGSPRAVRKHS